MSDTETKVKEIFGQMPLNFDAAAAKDLRSVIQLNLTGEGGGTYHLAIADGTCSVNEGPHASPDTIIIIEAGDYVELARGKLSHQVALRSGRLKIAGNIDLAMKMQPLFLMGGPGTYGPGEPPPDLSGPGKGQPDTHESGKGRRSKSRNRM
ncbi:MAG: SCP2 sterol-binding domain-containing protein [Candidatus Binatia bacterium]